MKYILLILTLAACSQSIAPDPTKALSGTWKPYAATVEYKGATTPIAQNSLFWSPFPYKVAGDSILEDTIHYQYVVTSQSLHLTGKKNLRLYKLYYIR